MSRFRPGEGYGQFKSLVATVLINMTGPRLQQALRRYHLSRIILRDRYSREPEMDALEGLIVPGDVVADVGANAGSYTKQFSSLVGPQGRVYSFEPIPETFEVLQQVVRRAGLENVSIFQIALGPHARHGRMVIPQEDGFTGYYLAHFAKPDEAGNVVGVTVRAFDGLTKDQGIDRLDFIKCDVEGSELDVLYGSADLILRFKPGWLIEVSRATSEEVFEFLVHRHGYQAYVYSGGLVPTRMYRDKEYSNYFFVHRYSAVWQRARKMIVA